MSREARDREHDTDPPDYADAHDSYYLVDEANDVRFAVCRSCLHVVCTCDEEAPDEMRRYRPAQVSRRSEPE